VNEGDDVTITLHNGLSEATSLTVRGASMPTDRVGVAPGQTRPYHFTASGVGTHLYEAGVLVNSQHQVAMGLYGVLDVSPSSGPVGGPSAYIVIGDIDPALNAGPASFDMRNFNPKYQTINGKPYPGVGDLATAAPGEQLRVHYLNAGINYHSMSVLGGNQQIVADDGHPLAHPYKVVAQTVGPGQSFDAIVTIPSTAAAGTRLAIFDANLQLNNRNRRPANSGAPLVASATFGGAVGFVSIGAGSPPPTDTLGPIVSGMTSTRSQVLATISDTTTGGNTIQQAEYFVDTVGAPGSGAALLANDGVFDQATEGVHALFPSGLSSAGHTVYVRGQDSIGNWGPLGTVVIPAVTSGDTTGPVITGVTLSPNPTNGSLPLTLHATASDATTGGSNIASAEYRIGTGAWVPMSVNLPAVTASIDATIAASTVNALSADATIQIRATDSVTPTGNTGQPASTTLIIDKSAPTTGAVSLVPSGALNGLTGVNSSTPAVRVSSSAFDISGVAKAEGFIDTIGATGAGFLFVPTDGAWGGTFESLQSDIPLSTIRGLSDGSHSISVHTLDGAGNWGPFTSQSFVVDKTAPTVGSVTLTPSFIGLGANTTALSVVTSDGAGAGVVSGQYWIDGTATPPANPTSFNGSNAIVGTSALAGGTHLIWVRVLDAAGNWSVAKSATLAVVQAIDDSATVTANTSTTQTINNNASSGVLVNDLPGGAGRTVVLASAPVRTGGTGIGTLTLSCPGSLGTAAPSVSGNTICTNGAYRITLTGVGNNNSQRRASKRGTFSFRYTMTLGGASSTATVTITVN
jgi:hypothetical protein